MRWPDFKRHTKPTTEGTIMADTSPLVELHDHINAALDTLAKLDAELHGRETGQVEYKLNEAKLWLGVVPGAIQAILTAASGPAGAIEEIEHAGQDFVHAVEEAIKPATDPTAPVSPVAPVAPTAPAAVAVSPHAPGETATNPPTDPVPGAPVGGGGTPTADVKVL